ncbi:hypothetical protein TrLO_g1704 [Triparma laevis f. longispina]|uniref:Uncharacterized protein n=1 Tax=Triparma laevis f. longispina TaxID=1714387 RepID=A0A9W7FRK8_9STRA|nr:hypothetical protein TrLO_g1704 [Triparma laevis f. longispina]
MKRRNTRISASSASTASPTPRCTPAIIPWFAGGCMQELMTRSQPCPICRKPISGFDVGVYSGSLGERGLWLTSARNIRELATDDGFNEYFRK